MRPIKIFTAIVLSLATAVGSSVVAADIPPLPAQDALKNFQVIPSCANITKVCSPCSGSDLLSGGYWEDGKWCKDFRSSGSIIDNFSYSHLHTAIDYRAAGLDSTGCVPCGGSSTPNVLEGGLKPLALVRTHRFRNMTERSSFGPGVFSNYDVTLRIAKKDTGAWQVIMTDPGELAPFILVDSGGGVFKGSGWNFIQGLRFYLGANGTGAITADPSLAVSAVLTGLQGYTYTFDVFNPYGSLPTPWTYGEIGAPKSHGTAGVANNLYSLSASGTDIWGTADSFGYVYQAFQGDTTVTARVDSFSTYRGLKPDGTHANAKAGIMLRAGLDANAPMVNLSLSPSGLEFVSRTGAGVAAVQDIKQAAVVAPRWLRLQRQGDLITGSTSTDGTTWTTVTSKTVVLGSTVFSGLSLTSHNSGGVLSDATYSGVGVAGAPVAKASWPVPTTAPYTSATLAGRLTTLRDRNGYGDTLTYKTWTGTELQQSPTRQWQLNTVTDAHGRRLTFQYGATQVSGRWAVSSVTLPNGSQLNYTYTNGLLTQVAYPAAEGTVSTFTYTPDANTNTTIVGYDDSGAETTHRRKQTYLSNQYSGDISNNGTYNVYNQASQLIRLLLNGNGEVGYLSIPINDLKIHIYEGGGRAMEITKLTNAIQVRYFDTWTFSSTTGFTGTFEPTFTKLTYPSENLYRQGAVSQSISEQGVVKTHTADATGYVTKATYSDGTTEVMEYNTPFKQKTRYKDRLNRVTKWTFDTRGNELTRAEGILFNGTIDVNQPEYAVFTKEYYPAGDAHQYLLKATIDALGRRTTFTYTPVSANGDNHFVQTVVTPADTGTGTITSATFGYDTAGRQISSRDALNRTATFAYDSRDRLIKTTYADTSTEIIGYGTGTDKNLVVRKKDRQGALSEFAYDLSGRQTTATVGLKTMSADGTVVTVIPTATVNAESLSVQTVTTYVPGSELPATLRMNGNLSTMTYDYRRRLVSKTQYPTSTSSGLTTTNTYVNNLLRQVTDPYGRKTYYVYRASDARLIRTVQGLIPADGLASYADAATVTRPSGTNPVLVITDFGLDAEGQKSTVTDPRGIIAATTFDSRGRSTSYVEASTRPEAGRTEMVYDLQSNVTEVRTPRYFDATDTRGYQKARVTMTYTNRNLLASQTAAPGTTEAGAQYFSYFADGRLKTRTDERGKLWDTTWGACCARIQGEEEPSVTLPGAGSATRPSRITRHNDAGDLTHEAVIKNYTASVFPVLPTPTNSTNLIDADTVNEVTTAYDVRHRARARTVWLSARGVVDANSPPIAGQNGVPAAQGLTTLWRYDDNLTDALGLSNPSDLDSVAPHLSGLGFGANAVGRAVVELNPAGERRWTIYDGVGRTVRVIDGNGNKTTTAYDVVESGLVVISVTDGGGHVTTRLVDAANRVRTARDGLGVATSMNYDANGNRITVTDANGVGQTCTYDGRNRDIQCIDTANARTERTYDAEGNLRIETDALLHLTTNTFDARNRKVSTLDRIGGTTTFAYDAASNLLSITDAEQPTGRVTTYAYEDRGLRSTETFPPGKQTPGATEDKRTYTYDAAHRLVSRTDQALKVTGYTYDFANRLTNRTYPDALNDGFAYDAASRLTSATSARFATSVARTFASATEKAGRLVSETQTVGGYTYTVGYGYDADNLTTTITYPNTKQVVRAYNARHQLTGVSYDNATPGTPNIITRSYDTGGRQATTAFNNGLTETRGYDAVKKDWLVKTIVTPAVTNFGYTYDVNKRKLSETHQFTADNQSFTAYDDENRLTGWNRNNVDTQSWSLSKVGDWLSTTRNGAAETRTHSPVHETLTTTIGGVTTNLDYDKNGNLTLDQIGQRYDWDLENRLSAARAGASTSGYRYDALGRRLGKVALGLVTTFVHDGARVIAEYQAPVLQSTDIGAPAIAGSFSDDGLGSVTVAASGDNIWNSADQFRYAYIKLTGNGVVTARLQSQYNTNQWAKAGVMLRDTLANNAQHVSLFLTPNQGVEFQTRLSTGIAATSVATGTGTAQVPIWLRLTRTGTTVTAERSPDGIAWTLLNTATITFNQTTIYAGLAVCAQNAAQVSTAVFTNVSITGNTQTTATPTYARGYVYGAYVDELLAILPASGLAADRKFAQSNHLYNVVALTGNTGSVLERYRYDAYGVRTVLAADGSTVRAASSHGNQVGFTGRYLDQESKLWYFRSRMYSPALGRFISRDPGDDLVTALGIGVFSDFAADPILTPIDNLRGTGQNDGSHMLLRSMNTASFDSPLFQDIRQPNAYQYAQGSPASKTDPNGQSVLLVCSLIPVCSAAIFCSANLGACSGGIVCSGTLAGACSGGVVCSGVAAGACSGSLAACSGTGAGVCSGTTGACSGQGAGACSGTAGAAGLCSGQGTGVCSAQVSSTANACSGQTAGGCSAQAGPANMCSGQGMGVCSAQAGVNNMCSGQGGGACSGQVGAHNNSTCSGQALGGAAVCSGQVGSTQNQVCSGQVQGVAACSGQAGSLGSSTCSSQAAALGTCSGIAGNSDCEPPTQSAITGDPKCWEKPKEPCKDGTSLDRPRNGQLQFTSIDLKSSGDGGMLQFTVQDGIRLRSCSGELEITYVDGTCLREKLDSLAGIQQIPLTSVKGIRKIQVECMDGNGKEVGKSSSMTITGGHLSLIVVDTAAGDRLASVR